MLNIFIKKCQKSVQVDWEALPEHVRQHLIEYGIRQKLNDVHSDEANPDTAFEMVEILLARLVEGDISKRAVGDPVKTMLRKMLREVAKLRTGKKGKDINELSIEQLVESIAKATGKDGEAILDFYQEKAVAKVEEEAKDRASLSEGLEDL